MICPECSRLTHENELAEYEYYLAMYNLHTRRPTAASDEYVRLRTGVDIAKTASEAAHLELKRHLDACHRGRHSAASGG